MCARNKCAHVQKDARAFIFRSVCVLLVVLVKNIKCGVLFLAILDTYVIGKYDVK